MTVPFTGARRFVWTQEGDVCVTPEELTEHSGGDVRGELGLLVGQTATWGDGGEVLPCSEGESFFAMIGLLCFLITGEVQNWTEVKSNNSCRSTDDTKVVKGTQKNQSSDFHKVRHMLFPHLPHADGPNFPFLGMYHGTAQLLRFIWGLDEPLFCPSLSPVSSRRDVPVRFGLVAEEAAAGGQQCCCWAQPAPGGHCIPPLLLPSGCQLGETSGHTTSGL